MAVGGAGGPRVTAPRRSRPMTWPGLKARALRPCDLLRVAPSSRDLRVTSTHAGRQGGARGRSRVA